MAHSDLEIGRLTADDLSGADALVQEAGWNQTEADWRIFLEFGTVYAIRDGGRIVATAATLPYGSRFAWISMVLIAGSYRRQGLGSRLMRRCIDDLVAADLVPILDATPAGRGVYLNLGFEDSWGFTRMLLSAPPSIPSNEGSITVEPISDAAWDELCRYDAAIFGADRSQVLRGMRGRLPEAEYCVWRGGHIAGFLLGRRGRRAAQIGPLVAENDEIARALLSQTLEALSPPVYIDVIDEKAAITHWLAAAGFVAERPLTRMLYRRNRAFQDVTPTYAVVGPEFG